MSIKSMALPYSKELHDLCKQFRFGYSDEIREKMPELLKDAPYEFNEKNIMRLLDFEKKLTEFNGVRSEFVATTFNHSVRVAGVADLIAKKAGMQKSERELLKKAALLHDIGKVMIPEVLLYKQGRFNDREEKLMDTHSKWSTVILKAYFGDNVPRAVLDAAEKHHVNTEDRFTNILRYADQAEAILSTERTYKNGQPADRAKKWITKVTPDIKEIGDKTLDMLRDEMMIDRNGNIDMTSFAPDLQNLIKDKSITKEKEAIETPGSPEMHMRKVMTEIQDVIKNSYNTIKTFQSKDRVSASETLRDNLRGTLEKYPWSEIHAAINYHPIRLEYSHNEKSMKPFKDVFLRGGLNDATHMLKEEILLQRNISAVCFDQPTKNMEEAKDKLKAEVDAMRKTVSLSSLSFKEQVNFAYKNSALKNDPLKGNNPFKDNETRQADVAQL